MSDGVIGGTEGVSSEGSTGADAGSSKESQGAGESTKGASSVSIPDNWKEALPEDLRNDPSMGHIESIEALGKSYVHAQKSMGKDKFFVPDESATEDDWNHVYGKLGRPHNSKDYAFEFQPDDQVDEAFLGKYKDAVHEAGLSTKQAQKLINWYVKESKEASETHQTQSKQEVEASLDELKQEWGNAYQSKVNQCNLFIKHFDKDGKILETMKEQGLTNNTSLIRLFAAAGSTLSEGTIKGDGGAGGAKTPQESLSKLNAIYANLQHPYYMSSHPGHAAAVKEVEALNKEAYPEVQTS